MRSLWSPASAVRLVVAAALLMLAAPARADVIEEMSQPTRKLSRGLANVGSGIFEVPLGMQLVGAQRGPVAGMSLGFMLGLGGALTRTGIGLVEILTFPFPIPGIGYGPLLYPEFLFEPGTSSQVY